MLQLTPTAGCCNHCTACTPTWTVHAAAHADSRVLLSLHSMHTNLPSACCSSRQQPGAAADSMHTNSHSARGGGGSSCHIRWTLRDAVHTLHSPSTGPLANAAAHGSEVHCCCCPACCPACIPSSPTSPVLRRWCTSVRPGASHPVTSLWWVTQPRMTSCVVIGRER